MAQIDEGQQIFSKPHGVISWNETKGQKLVNTISIDENKRGIHREWGFIGEAGTNIDNLLKKWADLKFFLKASVEVNSGIRGQTPLNLFDGKEQAGLALQLQAIARAAIAIGLEIDLTIGQLMKELESRPDTDDFQTQLLNIILEETKIEGVMYAQAAIAVMAYANLIITGSFFSNEQHEGGPGFKMIFDGGYGFIAGGGYRCYIQANIDEPKILIYRISDLTVTECMKKISPFSKIRIMEAPLQMGLRLAYTLGENLRKNFIVGDPRINQTTVIIIEEGQKWFLHQFNKFARENMETIIRSTGISTYSVSKLLNILNERVVSIDEMKEHLGKIKDLSFEISSSLPPAYQETWLKQTCIIWVSMNLYITVSEQQLKETIEYYPFHGTIEIPDPISAEIKKHIENPPSGPLQIEHLMDFLFKNILSPLLEQQSDISYVIEIYKNAFQGNDQEVLQHLFNFLPSNTTSPDKDTLAKLYNGLNTFYQTHMYQIMDLLEKEIPVNTELVYVLKHSILPSLTLLLDVIIPEMLNGFHSGADKKENMVEALSSSLLPLVGRTLIQIQDGILSKTKGQLAAKLREAAKELKNKNLPEKIKKYSWEQFIVFDIEEYLYPLFVKTLEFDKYFDYKNILINLMLLPMQKALEFIAELIESYSYPKNIFNDMEEVLTPITDWDETIAFYTNLADPKSIPQKAKVKALLEEIGKYMLRDMQKFNTEMIENLLNTMLKKLQEDIELAVNLVQSLLGRLLEEINKELVKIVLDPIVLNPLSEHVIKQLNLSEIDKLTHSIKKLALDELNKTVGKGIKDNILSPITNALNDLNINAQTIIDIFRGNELNSENFRNVIIKHIENHLSEKIEDTLSIDVNFKISVPDINPGSLGIPGIHGGIDIPDISYTFDFGSIHLDSKTIINTIINALLVSFQWNEEFEKLNFAGVITFVYFLEEEANKYAKTIPKTKKHYIDLLRNFPVNRIVRDILLITQHHIKYNDHMEFFIHFPDNNIRADDVIIKLNDTEIPLNCFSFHKNTQFLNRQNNALLYGVAPFDKLKNNINTLQVFYQNIESKLSFSIE
ncbi:hypothetical protein CN582_24645 [Bacillus wiedmannii]|uniref:hypothetical protein n=1 Tax=Bacillus wiedmannii TaxID=1890302 RepID=UPI000BF7B591|nr:hypothetical protein [Bacillus wiedmannii]PEP92707.1 hypothetical protein CN582_24645 [Bacillus wiedmannii]